MSAFYIMRLYAAKLKVITIIFIFIGIVKIVKFKNETPQVLTDEHNDKGEPLFDMFSLIDVN